MYHSLLIVAAKYPPFNGEQGFSNVVECVLHPIPKGRKSVGAISSYRRGAEGERKL